MSEQPYLGTALLASLRRKGLEKVPCTNTGYHVFCSQPWLTNRKICGCKTQTNNNTPVPIFLTIPSSLLGGNWPERRTVLVTRELARYKVDIAALSETRFSEQGQLEEVGAGDTFWSGRPKAERRDAGVAVAI
ncbi:unnamed protein product [Schistocephalus solidus]|uniref:Uncharacterized protein n=1 Tax=Schistocephalus solidus TaxID=70667 RepID=A0A183STD6_SCHSO|nr:unnamed protein product [Schistocephalus solidus]